MTDPTFSHPLAGVPVIESPFFDRILNENTTDAQTLAAARQLRENGYAVIDFPDPDILARADRIKVALNDRYEWEEWRAKKRPSLRVQDAWAFNEDVMAIAAHPRILGLLSTLYGRQAFAFQTLNFPVGTQQALHSDAIHFSSHPERFMCGVWVALEDIDADCGPLLYVPGSHRWPFYTNEHLAVNPVAQVRDTDHYHRYEQLWRSLVEVNGARVERFCARKGQALIWAANLLHGGDRQNDLSRTRWSQVTHYYFADCSYYTPIRSEPFYGRIHFRELKDIVTGRPVVHSVCGLPVPADFIERVKPRPNDLNDPEVLRRAGLPDDFDAEGYLRLNPDVRAAGVDPVHDP